MDLLQRSLLFEQLSLCWSCHLSWWGWGLRNKEVKLLQGPGPLRDTERRGADCGEQCPSRQMLHFCRGVVHRGLTISWRGGDSVVWNLKAWLVLLSATWEHAHRSKPSFLPGLMWILWAPGETILFAGSRRCIYPQLRVAALPFQTLMQVRKADVAIRSCPAS